jgi:arylsulfatase A-like enzyme
MDEFLWRQLPFAVSHNDGPFFEPNEYMTDYLSKRTAEAITSTRSSGGPRVPFFVEVCFNAPHNPLHATLEDYNAAEIASIPSHRLRVYAAMIRALDRGIKRILDAVKEIGAERNTIIVFSSDNGGAEYLGLRELNKPFRGWKGTFFEGGLRVPMFMKWPAKIPRLSVVDSPVGHVDMFATLSAAARVEDRFYKRRMDGWDVMPLIEALPEKFSARDCPDKYSLTTSKALYWRSGHYVAFRICDWKLQLAERPHKLWLYDLSTDPNEQNNLAKNISLNKAVEWAARGCYPTDPMTLFPEVFSDGIRGDAASMLTVLCDILQRLKETEELQVPPSWPALSELVMPIDHPINVDGMEGCGECAVRSDEEYIYWPI